MAAIIQWIADTLRPVFSDVLLALIIILIGFILGKLFGRFTQRFLSEFSLSKLVAQSTGFDLKIEDFFGKFVSYTIYLIAVLTALDQMGLKTYIINIISVAFLIIIILSVFLSIKDFIPNIMAGFFLLRRRQIEIGDRIRFQNIEGKVIRVSLLETKVETRNRDQLFIPNALLTQKEFMKLGSPSSGRKKGKRGTRVRSGKKGS
ncbi:MAG: mechanosensitive ion channel [DPANN group archaeon]|nr:mechanosensitive ion channel [DPANN group archaeon]